MTVTAPIPSADLALLRGLHRTAFDVILRSAGKGNRALDFADRAYQDAAKFTLTTIAVEFLARAGNPDADVEACITAAFEHVARCFAESELPDSHFSGKSPIYFASMDNALAARALELRDPGNTCPDGGVCGHWCRATCFRVEHCGPLSGVYPGDDWPKSVRPQRIKT